jgi:hypothetical protein
VYVIGVSKERGEACIYGTPPKRISLKRLKPLKRGFPIPDTEIKQREAAFPGVTWDKREN